jgi:hypothetical protein
MRENVSTNLDAICKTSFWLTVQFLSLVEMAKNFPAYIISEWQINKET